MATLRVSPGGAGGGLGPLDPRQVRAPAEVYGLSHGSRLDAATRDPTTPASDTMSRNPAALTHPHRAGCGGGVTLPRDERPRDESFRARWPECALRSVSSVLKQSELDAPSDQQAVASLRNALWSNNEA